jgi:hypothetical protein
MAAAASKQSIWQSAAAKMAKAKYRRRHQRGVGKRAWAAKENEKNRGIKMKMLGGIGINENRNQRQRNNGENIENNGESGNGA